MTRLDTVETLARLVSIPSLNPMGREVSGAPFLEQELTRALEETFERLGLTVSRHPVAPGRENLIARLDGEIHTEEEEKALIARMLEEEEKSEA